MSDHLSRKELKQDKVRETIEHGAQAVFSHTTIAAIAVLAVAILVAGYFGWNFYSGRQNAQAQDELDGGLKIYNAALITSGQPALPGEPTYSDSAKRALDAQVKFAAVAAKYPSATAGQFARYYSALCLMDLDKLNQASEDLNRLTGSSNKEVAALAKYQLALIAERNGKKDEAIQSLRALSTGDTVLVSKPLVLLELARLLRATDAKQATTIYEQLKKDYPNSSVADEADQALSTLAPKS